MDAVIDACGEAGIPIRIGVNAGSLDEKVAARQDLTLPEKLVASAEGFVEHFRDRGFLDVVLSAKAHSVPTTLATYRALSRLCPRSRFMWASPRRERFDRGRSKTPPA